MRDVRIVAGITSSGIARCEIREYIQTGRLETLAFLLQEEMNEMKIYDTSLYCQECDAEISVAEAKFNSGLCEDCSMSPEDIAALEVALIEPDLGPFTLADFEAMVALKDEWDRLQAVSSYVERVARAAANELGLEIQ
jgi:hypothetical protein